MSTKMTRLMKRSVLLAALSLLVPAAAWADTPGYEFMTFQEGMCLVVDNTGQAPKGKISEEDAKAITAGAQPVSEASIILMYHGKVYIVPDKRLADGRMASDVVKSAGSAGSSR